MIKSLYRSDIIILMRKNIMKKNYGLLCVVIVILWVYSIGKLVFQWWPKEPSCRLIEKNGKLFTTLPLTGNLENKARNEITIYDLQYSPLIDASKLEILFLNKEAHRQEDFVCFYKDENYVYGLLGDVLVPLFSGFDNDSLQILTGCRHYVDDKEFVWTCALGWCFQDKNTVFYPGDEVGTYLQGTGIQLSGLIIFDECKEKW